MNFGNIGFSELLLMLFFGFLFRVVPIVIVIWLLIAVRRMRRQITRLTERLDTLAALSS